LCHSRILFLGYTFDAYELAVRARTYFFAFFAKPLSYLGLNRPNSPKLSMRHPSC
jgi:hypothetical protein